MSDNQNELLFFVWQANNFFADGQSHKISDAHRKALENLKLNTNLYEWYTVPTPTLLSHEDAAAALLRGEEVTIQLAVGGPMFVAPCACIIVSADKLRMTMTIKPLEEQP